jgi:hypothetical protein
MSSVPLLVPSFNQNWKRLTSFKLPNIRSEETNFTGFKVVSCIQTDG